MVGVTALREDLGRLVADLDPDAVPLPDAPGLWEEFDRVEKLAASAKMLLARRVDESGRWARDGFKDPADYLAAKAGSSRTAARQQLDTSSRLTDLAATEAAVRQGTLSTPQANAIADAAAVNPEAEEKLLDTAKKENLGKLREECGRAKAKDRDETHRRIHRHRRLRQFTDGEGGWNLSARGTADAGATVDAALKPIIEELFTAARRSGNYEARDAYAFDALVELARRALHGSNDTKSKRSDPTHLALLRVDLEALRRGQVEGDELCELTGVGPVPVRVARDLLGESIVKLVITKGVDVLNVTHLGRKATIAPAPGAGGVLAGRRRSGGEAVGVDQRSRRSRRRTARTSGTRDAPPRLEDLQRLGVGRRHRETTHGPARRPPAPQEPGRPRPARTGAVTTPRPGCLLGDDRLDFGDFERVDGADSLAVTPFAAARCLRFRRSVAWLSPRPQRSACLVVG